MDRPNLAQHREIFNELLEEFRYSAKYVSSLAGISETRLSRFRTGKLDLEVGEFLDLLSRLPKEFQKSFWSRLLCVDISGGNWRSLILSADPSDIQEILRLLAERWAVLQPTEKSLTISQSLT